MITIKENISLAKLHTFHTKTKAKYYCAPNNETELTEVISYAKENNLDALLLGGGSNMFFRDNYNGIVIHPQIEGIQTIIENDAEVLVKAYCGVNWDNFVQYCVSKNWQGLENLSLIPGNIGACPIQNIGAYGVEVKDFITHVDGFYLDTLKPFSFNNKACEFGYRDSVFKRKLKGKVVITSVTFRLNKKPDFKLEYGSLNDEVCLLGEVNLLNIRQAVINIREAKLPDSDKLGNAGSFFKNPVISKTAFRILIDTYRDMPYYNFNDSIKIPAGWLIEKAGWKGKREGNVGVHEKQALIIVNYGDATGQEIIQFSDKIIKDINYIFNVRLEREVNIF